MCCPEAQSKLRNKSGGHRGVSKVTGSPEMGLPKESVMWAGSDVQGQALWDRSIRGEGVDMSLHRLTSGQRNLEAKARGSGHYHQMVLRCQSLCYCQSNLCSYKNEDYQWTVLWVVSEIDYGDRTTFWFEMRGEPDFSEKEGPWLCCSCLT